MSIKRFAVPALVGAMLLGCDMPNPGQPSTTTSPAPGASTAPTAGASAGVGANVGASVGNWKVGQKYTYDMKVLAAGKTTTGMMTWEVIKIEGNMVTIKTSSEVGGVKSPETTSTFDASNKEGQAKASAQADVTTTLTSTTKEAVTVPAGTYANATKYVYTMSGKAQGTMTSWVDDTAGLVKSVSEIKPETPALPPGVTLPGGLDLSSTSTLELKSVTM